MFTKKMFRMNFDKIIAFCSVLLLVLSSWNSLAATALNSNEIDKSHNKIPSYMKPGTIITFDENGKLIILSEGSDNLVSLSKEDKKIAENCKPLPEEDLPEVEPGMIVVYDALGAPVVIHQGQEEPLKIDLKEVKLDEIKTNDSKSEKIENKANDDENSNNILQQGAKKLNTETGYISWYNGEGKKGAAGVILDSESAAHKTIKFWTRVKVTSLENGKSTTVKILDRGPYVQGRILDMVKTAFSKIHNPSKGIFRGKIEWPIQS